MTTLGDLIEYTRHSLSGFDSSREYVTALATAIDATDTTLAVADLENGGQSGLVEIDLELMRIKTVDEQSLQVLLQPFGRGYRGSTATTHSVGAEVKFNPSWSSYAVGKEINGVLGELYPMVYGLDTHETTFPANGGPVDVPTDAIGIVSVWTSDAFGNWHEARRWHFRPDSVDTNYKLAVAGSHAAGDAVRVVYAKRPVLFDLDGSLSQNFATVTGLDDRLADLVRLGVAYRMAPHIDLARLPFLESAPRDAGNSKPSNGGAQAARLLLAMFKQRLSEEAQVLRSEHPFRVHSSGVY